MGGESYGTGRRDRADRHPDRGRRPGGLPCRRPRPQAALRRVVPRRARRVRRVRARRAARAEAARGPGGGDPGRLPHAPDERHRVPGTGPGRVPGRAPGAADRVRGHARGDRRHQRRRPRPLSPQALGPARGEALPGPRRSPPGLALQRLQAGAEHQGRRAPLVGAVLGGARVPGPQSGAVPLVLGGRAGGAAAAGRRRAGRAAAAARGHPGRPVRHTGRGSVPRTRPVHA